MFGKNMKRPISLILVAALFLLVGVGAIWQMVTQTSSGHVFINPLALIILVGIGLLRLSSFWRLCALVCVLLLFIVVVMGLLMTLLNLGGVSGLPISVSGTPVGFAVTLSLLGWMIYVLNHHDVRNLFLNRDA